MGGYILALDQGTTSSRAIIFNHNSEIVGTAQNEFSQIYPKAGWVEHDPMEIWGSQSGVLRQVLEKNSISPEEIKAIGITNQRETTILWDKNTGRPIYNGIVWQCRRTAYICEELKNQGHENLIKEKTGLVIDPYFSATKIKWILDNVDGARDKADNGELLFGTVDSWLIWNLTRGEVHLTDYTNASRTMLFNINTLKWDEDILNILDIPKSILPDVKDSSFIFGHTDEKTLAGAKIPIAASIGDQQSSLFGQLSLAKGMAKNTYGTGCFVLMNTGDERVVSKNGLLTTIAWSIDGKITYALEGSIFMGGASIQWLRDELRLIYDSAQSEYYANLVDDTNGVYVVPAFTGLGAPYWDPYARGSILGITRGVRREHIVRATLEAISYQTKDVLNAMQEDSKINLKELRVDGGASDNGFLMQFQSDILGVNVKKSDISQTTALGTAYLAGLKVGFWSGIEDIENNWSAKKIFTPKIEANKRNELYSKWKKAIKRSMNWDDESS